MSESFARLLKLKPSPAPQDVKLVSANRSPITSLGVVDVDLSIQGLVVPFTFHVLKSLSHQVILGHDFLRSSGAVIDCANRCISLFEGLVNASLTNQRDRDATLQLAQNVVIPAATEAIVRVCVPSRFQNRTSLVETYEPIKNKFLLVAGALVHPTDRFTICRVLNAGLTPRKLRIHTPIAKISNIDLEDPYNRAMLSIDTCENRAYGIPLAKTDLPPHEQRVQVLQAKGLVFDNPHLSYEQFSRLTALLYEYQEIFCADYD